MTTLKLVYSHQSCRFRAEFRNTLSLLLLFAGGLQAQTLPRFDATPGRERAQGALYVDEGGQEIYWPKAVVSAEDVYSGAIHRAEQPRRGYTEADWVTEGFAVDRLSDLPPPGEHPRLYITPTDFQRIRDHVAMGEEAPRYFQTLWQAVLEQGGILKDGEKLDFTPAEFTGTGYSMVNNFIRQIIYAQVMNDDELGRALAESLYKASLRDHQVLDLMDTRPDRDNVWMVTDTRWLPDGHEFKPYGQWYFPSYPESYDYAWRWLSEEERASVRGVIARLQNDRYTHFMELPSNRHLINHASMAMLWMAYPLVIEGEEGYNRENYEFARAKAEEVLEYYISPDGVMYENVKGFLPWQIYLAIARREGGGILQHPHIFEHMRQTFSSAKNLQNPYVSWTRPPIPRWHEAASTFLDPRKAEARSWQIDSSGHPAALFAMMNWFYPERPDFDFIYKTRAHTDNLTLFADKSIPTSIRDVEYPALQLAFATDGMADEAGEPINWNRKPIEFEAQTSRVDLERGVAQIRSSWDKDALQVTLESRSDFYTGGHETPEFGNFTFAAHGVLWAPYFLAYQPSIHRNVVTVNGQNGEYPPVATHFVGFEDNDIASTAVMDYSLGMQFKQHARNELILHPKLEIPFHHWMRGAYGWGRERTWQKAFQPHNRWFDEYLASVDFGHWGGQNTGGTWYERILPEVDHAWRTFQMVKGERPFILVLDDLKLSEGEHSFRWNLNLLPEAVLIRQPTPDILILGRYDIPADRNLPPRPLNYKPANGEPLLLVQVLNRDTTDAFPRPAFEFTDGKAMISVPATGKDPAYKVLVFPFRQGESLPAVTWSENRERLRIIIGDDEYAYHFGAADKGRTVFTMTKNSELAQVQAGRPPRPVFVGLPPAHPSSRYEREGPELGPPPQRPDAETVPTRLFTDTATLAFDSVGPGLEVRYTTDGSEPGPESTLYTGPVDLEDSAVVKAIAFSRDWPWGDRPVSEVRVARFVKEDPAESVGSVGSVGQGLLAEVFEIFVPEWDRYGFVNPSIQNLPDLNGYTPILQAATEGFVLPAVRPRQPIEEVYKGFYRFTGYVEIRETGVHGFRIYSNGPVRLRIAGETVMEETGLYHQDLRHRYAQAALAPGLHSMELIITDPIFWKKGREGDMPFEVSVKSPGNSSFIPLGAERTFADAGLLARHAENPFAVPPAELPVIPAVEPSVPVTRGLLRSVYGRVPLVPPSDGWIFTRKAGPEGLFDVEGQPPLASSVMEDEIVGSDYDGQLYVYTGWYRAPYDGVYAFELDAQGNNRLRIGGEIVVQNNVPGVQADGRIQLEKGLHPIEIIFGRSRGDLRVKTPVDREFQAVVFGDLLRPEQPALVEDPEQFLILSLPESAYAKDEQTVSVPAGEYRLAVEGTRVLEDAEMGTVLEFIGEGSGLRLYDWPAVGRFLTMSFWVKMPEGAQSREFLQIGREGTTGSLGGNGVQITYPRFYHSGNNLRIPEMAAGEWVHLVLQWGRSTRIYVNGELRSEVFTGGDPMIHQRPHNQNARSGQMQLFVGRNGTFQGRIADLRVYNMELTAEQARAAYEAARK